MLSTSALVLTVLTVTGAYVRNHNRSSLDDGYTLDFTALEDRADDKLREISKGSDRGTSRLEEKAEMNEESRVKAGSDEVKIPGLTAETETVDQSTGKSMSDMSKSESAQEKTRGTTVESAAAREETEAAAVEMAKNDETDRELVIEVAEANTSQTVVVQELHFPGDNLVRPVSGEVLIPYSMDHSVYFATLDQYKYNPAMIYGASEGEAVCSCARGRVMNVHEDPQLGKVVILDLGDGYQAIYGQLENVEVPIGATVEAGGRLGTVAAPTKYFSVEGSNLYFQILRDGQCIDPGQFF